MPPGESMAGDPEPEGYPAGLVADVVLADGGTMLVRPILPSDADRMHRFHERQSPESIYFRFFSPRPRLSARDVERFTQVDYSDRMAFVGIIDDELVGIARYDRHPVRSDAEVAFFTDDHNAGRGMATVLLEYLAAAAREVGISGFTAQVLPQNRRMLSVFQQAGFEVSSRFSDGVVEVELSIEPTEYALEQMEARAQRAQARSVERILAPRSVAVVGASRKAGTIGNVVFRRLLESGFAGPVFPINTEATSVASVRAYPSLIDVPDDIDLAVIVVPADQVLDVIEDCARKRIQGLIIMSAGFGELGSEGAELERRVVDRGRSLGLRLLGPNTMGAINTAPMVRLHASFTEVEPLPGRVAVTSQSGTIGAAVLDEFVRHRLGVSTFVATGNKADVSGNDLLQFWEDDPRTDVVVLYLESFGNPRNFGRIARRLSTKKPIVAVKSGRAASVSPGRPAGEGIEPLIDPVGWPSDVTFDALLRQTGVIRVPTLEELVDVTRLLAHQPLPAGRRLAVVSNFWGPAVLAADACAEAGLELVSLADTTVHALAAALPDGARVTNPVELTANAGPSEYGAAVSLLLADPSVDSLLVLHAPAIPARTAEIARAVASVASANALGVRAERTAPAQVVVSFLGPNADGDLSGLSPVPVFPFPETAVRAMGRVANYAEWRSLPVGEVPEWPLEDVSAAQRMALVLLESADADAGSGWLDPIDAGVLLSIFGIAVTPQFHAGSIAEVLAAASLIGYPVALKATGLARPARTESEGLAVDLHGDAELAAAYERMCAIHGADMRPALVQAMAPSGLNLTIGVHQHPTLGSILTVGRVDGDPILRILPLTDRDADRLVAQLGLTDTEPQALSQLLLALSGMAEAVPEVAQVRLEPVLVSGAGAFVTDVHLRLAPWSRGREPHLRRLH